METNSSKERSYRFAAGVVLSAFALVAASAGVLYWYREMLHGPSPVPDMNEGGAVAEADQAIGNGEFPAVKESLPENGDDGVVLGGICIDDNGRCGIGHGRDAGRDPCRTSRNKQCVLFLRSLCIIVG